MPNPIKWPKVVVVNEKTRFGYTFEGEFFSCQTGYGYIDHGYTTPRFHTYEGNTFMVVTAYFDQLPEVATLTPLLVQRQSDVVQHGARSVEPVPVKLNYDDSGTI